MFYAQVMEREPDRLAWLAMLIVDEAAEYAERVGRARPTLALRFALAFLCSQADGPTYELPSRRSVFDNFWTAVTEPDGAGPPNMVGYARASATRSALQQMGRQLRFGAGIFNSVREWRSPEARARRVVARALKDGDEEKARKAWRKRQGYFGRPYPADRPDSSNDA